MYYVFTCRGSPAYSSSVCLIEENPEIIEQAVFKKKNLLIRQVYLLFTTSEKFSPHWVTTAK